MARDSIPLVVCTHICTHIQPRNTNVNNVVSFSNPLSIYGLTWESVIPSVLLSVATVWENANIFINSESMSELTRASDCTRVQRVKSNFVRKINLKDTCWSTKASSHTSVLYVTKFKSDKQLEDALEKAQIQMKCDIKNLETPNRCRRKKKWTLHYFSFPNFDN